MLDRKTIKKDVKGILGGESKGSVFLATLIVFIMGALAMVGTLLSDILLALTDPRIRNSM